MQINNLPCHERNEKHYEFLKAFVFENPLFSAMKLELSNEELDKLVAMIKLQTCEETF